MNKSIVSLILLVFPVLFVWGGFAVAYQQYQGKKDLVSEGTRKLKTLETGLQDVQEKYAAAKKEVSNQIDFIRAWEPFLTNTPKVKEVMRDIYKIGNSRNDLNNRVEIVVGARSSKVAVIGESECQIIVVPVTAEHEDLSRLFNFVGRIQETYPQAKFYSLKFSENSGAGIPRVEFELGFNQTEYKPAELKIINQEEG
jgi:hypothetical protein